LYSIIFLFPWYGLFTNVFLCLFRVLYECMYSTAYHKHLDRLVIWLRYFALYFMSSFSIMSYLWKYRRIQLNNWSLQKSCLTWHLKNDGISVETFSLSWHISEQWDIDGCFFRNYCLTGSISSINCRVLSISWPVFAWYRLLRTAGTPCMIFPGNYFRCWPFYRTFTSRI
jgi:hypothetical protein